MNRKITPVIFWGLFLLNSLLAQTPGNDTTKFSLNDCLKYAVHNQPNIQQAIINEEITSNEINASLSKLFPQITADGKLQHYIQQPQSYFPDFTNPGGPKRLITTGVRNSSSLLFSATQNIYNNEDILALKTGKYLRRNAKKNTSLAIIDVVVNVSKAFYDVLVTQQQYNLSLDDVNRLERNLKDTYSQYQNGITDKIDYQRATIALNNALAQKRNIELIIEGKNAVLKQLMGFPPNEILLISYDSISMVNDIFLDTSKRLENNNRIEYQISKIQMQIQNSKINYYRYGFLPSLSFFADYNLVFQNDRLPDLYSRSFPSSDLGLTLSFPIFKGFERIYNLKIAKLQLKQLSFDTLALRNQFNTEYIQAMATYKSNLQLYKASYTNLKIAMEVYNTIKYQYINGIKAYLDLILAESDLRSSQINYLDALFMTLSGKLDVQKAIGEINVNY